MTSAYFGSLNDACMILTEKKVRRYYLNYLLENTSTTAEVHEINMGGWTLFECFLLPHYELIQISKERNKLHCLDAEDGFQDHALQIMTMIANQLQHQIISGR